MRLNGERETKSWRKKEREREREREREELWNRVESFLKNKIRHVSCCNNLL